MEGPTDQIGDTLDGFIRSGVQRGLFTAGAVGVSHEGARTLRHAGTLARDDPRSTGARTLFDLASLTKTLVAAAAVRLIERGDLDPHAPLSDLLDCPPGSRPMTAHSLLTHTSGYPAESFAWRDLTASPDGRRDVVLATSLESTPGSYYRYSDVGFVAIGALLESVTGMDLREILSTLVAKPLGLQSVGYGPRERTVTAATEDESYVGRGIVHGEVHDELAWWLGGVSGNAGLFSSANDVLAFAESFLHGTLLSAHGVRMMSSDLLSTDPRAPYGQAYGSRVDDPSFIGPLRGYGHTGFTGTMWVVHPEQDVAAVLLTNRVHPVRTLSDLGPYRREFGRLLATLFT